MNHSKRYYSGPQKIHHRVVIGTMQQVKEVSNLLLAQQQFSRDQIAQERLRIITFYEEFGEKATKKAFKVDRKVIWVWKKRMKHGTLASLVPSSTRPKRARHMTTDSRIVSFVRELRLQHPRLGKEKIKPLLDQYCRKENLPTIQQSTIGKVIKRNNLFFQKTGRCYHNPASGFANQRRKKRLRIKHTPRPQHSGYIEMDTVVRFVDGLRVYLYSAIDVSSKFAFSLHYKNLNSQNTVDFFQKLELVCPFPITQVQTDNGLEFLGDFEDYLKNKTISHIFIYPRCCKINGVVERYQRSLQEEFLDTNLDIIHDPKLLNDKLIDYMLFYNTQRVHKSIGLITPMDYLLQTNQLSKMSVTHTRY